MRQPEDCEQLYLFSQLVTLPTIGHCRERPAQDEDADDGEAEIAEAVVELADRFLERPGKGELVADQPECLDAADQQRHQHGRCGDGQVYYSLRTGLKKAQP